MTADVVLIIPQGCAAHETGLLLQTPYGQAFGHAADGLPVLVRTEGQDPRALIYAARELGARRVLAGDVVQPVSPLLEPGDLVVPGDTIDQTRLRPFTFFVGKGYGFVKLNPPFCPDLMEALAAEGREVQPRTFRSATYVGTDGPRDATPAERAMYRQWGGDVAGSGLLPEAYLARELELCYGALTVVHGGDLYPVLRGAANRPHGGVPCTCRETMKLLKEQGVVEEDWHTW